MDLRPVIDDIVSRSDDLPAGIRDRRQARALLEELLRADYPALLDSDRRAVITGVVHELEDDDFFGTEYVGEVFGGEDESDE